MKKLDNTHLNKAIATRDNEFYTQYDDVKKIFALLHPYLKGKFIYCPFDGEQSNFVKYLKANAERNGWEYAYDDDYQIRSELYDKPNLVVISNPPFSIKKQIIDYYTYKGVKWCLVLPYMVENCMNKYLNTSVDLKIKWFIRPDGKTKNQTTILMSNWINFNKKVRFDGNCNHTESDVRYRRANVWWDCFNKHDLHFTRATWLPGVMDDYIITRRDDKNFGRVHLTAKGKKTAGEFHAYTKAILDDPHWRGVE